MFSVIFQNKDKLLFLEKTFSVENAIYGKSIRQHYVKDNGYIFGLMKDGRPGTFSALI